MEQRSLVAFHGDKPRGLALLLAECLEACSVELGERFVPYPLEQIHGTLIGLETLETAPECNAHLARQRGTPSPMDLDGYLEHVREVFRNPLALRFGGFECEARPFTSRERTPHDRSFSVQGNRVVLIGWPSAVAPGSGEWPQTLADLRRAGEAFGIGHAYHIEDDDRDNDFYLRLGLLSDLPDVAQRGEVETRLRRWLADCGPRLFELTASRIAVVEYVDETLPIGSTRRQAL